MYRVLDLFSGIGGFSLGLERTGGFKTVAFCEIEPYPRAVLRKHWPDVMCFTDVRLLNRRVLDMFDIGVDVICGGFPCQDISLAGKGAGIEGERSGLWSEMHRLVDECRPRWGIFENVAALRTRGYDRIESDLARIGYACRPFVVSAADIGAPHKRSRVWIIAYPVGEQLREQSGWGGGQDRSGALLAAGDGEDGNVAYPGSEPTERYAEAAQARQSKSSGGGSDVADTTDRGDECGGTRSRLGGLQEEVLRTSGHTYDWQVEPAVCRVANGVPARVHRLRALGNAVVPQIPEILGRVILEYERAA